MERVEILTHKGKKIVLINLSNSTPEETLRTLPLAKELIAKQGPKNALVLMDVTNAIYNKDVAAGIKDMSSANTPYVKASVVVGVTGVQSVLLQTVIMITRREIKTLATREQAKEWLANQ